MDSKSHMPSRQQVSKQCLRCSFTYARRADSATKDGGICQQCKRKDGSVGTLACRAQLAAEGKLWVQSAEGRKYLSESRTGKKLTLEHRLKLKTVGTQNPHERAERYIIRAESGCWLWVGWLDRKGYGMVGIGSKMDGTARKIMAHRFVYQLHRGDIPTGLDLDHLCRVHNCVNPDHLEPVTRKENLKRGIVAECQRERRLSRAHCKNGHAYSPENTGRDSNNHRVCKTCSPKYVNRRPVLTVGVE